MGHLSLYEKDGITMFSKRDEKGLEVGFWRAKPPREPQKIRFTFRNLVDLLCPLGSGDLDFIVVTGHNTAKGGKEQGIPDEAMHLRGGNFSDLQFLPKMISHFAAKLGSSLVEAKTLSIKIVPDIYLQSSDASRHNLILLGAGNVNWVTEYVCNKYWGNSEYLPLHFSTKNQHEIINSELSEREYARDIVDEDYGILEMVPSPYNESKVVILCCGIDSWGTQAALLALCNELSNNNFNPKYPAKVLRVSLSHNEIELFQGGKIGVRTINDLIFEE